MHAAVAANTFAVYGAGHVKELTELVPGILNQLGPDSLASLRKLAESYQAIQQSQQRPGGAEEDDDDVDLFGSDDEEDAEAERIKAERVKAYEAKKAAKPKTVAKVCILIFFVGLVEIRPLIDFCPNLIDAMNHLCA